MPTAIPTKEEVMELVRKNPSALQFKNSLKYVQTSTNMSLDRLNIALDLVLASIFQEGFLAGMEYITNGQKETSKVEVKGSDKKA